MLNRIRVVSLLMMVLVVFALLQFISGGMFFSSLNENQQSFAASHQLRLQQAQLNQSWNLLLQTRINLSRSAARMMMNANNQQSSAKTDLLNTAKKVLAEADTHFNAFKAVTVDVPEINAAAGDVEQSYRDYYQALSELVQYLETGNMDAYFAQATQGKQNVLEKAVMRYDDVNVRLAQQA